MLTRILGHSWPHGIYFDGGDPGGGNSNPAPTPTPDPPKPDPKKFTPEQQAEVDRLITERLNRQRGQFESQIAALTTERDGMKEKAEQFDALEREKQSDLQRLESERDAAAKEAKEAKEAAEKATNTARETSRRAAIVTAAAESGADPDLTYAFLKESGFKLTDVEDATKTYEVTIGDDGQVTGQQDAIKAAIAAKSGLVGKTPSQDPGPGDGGARPPAPSDLDLSNLDDPEKVREAVSKLG